FETVSGFTTTGSTLLPDVESMPMSLIMWRSFTHWIGGMGVLVFALALLPSGSAQSMYIMRAEVPGPSVGKLVAKTQLTARILYGIYIFFTVLEAVLLRLTGMRWFDCIANAFATAGTGGFSVLNSGIGGYGNVWVEIVITVFMLIFSINFNLFYMLLIRQFSEVLRNVEIKVFFGIYLTTTLLITPNIMPLYGGSFWRALRYAGFTTASLCSSTGFGTADFTLWPAFSQTILILLMFCGACAGSTGGGLKVARVMILVKSGVSEIRRQLNPRLISTVKLEGQVVENEQIRTQGAFFILYMIILLVSTLLLSMDRYGFDVSFSAALTALNNMGPGLGAIGPYGNFADFTPFSKLVIIFDMLVGRLEIFPILIAFMPRTWKKA
ncbi:MAG: TrkH family potassium uptake protein, partial [Clostridia bacterium]|nr:TrkH family potassium uptake protein [Clostridia bacterium]